MQAPVPPRTKLEFLTTKPTPNYVGGLGRGATGFTTRRISDLHAPPLTYRIDQRQQQRLPELAVAVVRRMMRRTRRTRRMRRKDTMRIRSLMSLKETTPVCSRLLSMMTKIRRLMQCGRLSIRGWIRVGRIGGRLSLRRKSRSIIPRTRKSLNSLPPRTRLLDESLKLFPSFFNLWLMLGQLEERLGYLEQAREKYELGSKRCPNCIPLWLSLAHLEEKVNGLSKARAVLTMARKKNPQNPELWLAAVRAESRHGNKLQKCPTSGILWAASLEMVPRPQQKTKSRDAYKTCVDDPHVLAPVGKIFWHDRKVDKARCWLNRAVTLAPDIGDFWALYYKFELQHGTEETQKDVLNRCVTAEPKHGEKWQGISKAVENSHQPTEFILKKVVVAIGKEEHAAEFVK